MDTRSLSREKSDLLSSVTKLLEEKFEQINQKLEKLDSIEKSIEDANEDLKKIPEFKIEVGQLKEEVKFTRLKLSEVQNENKSLREALLRQELYSRKNNVKIFGFKVVKSESLENALLTKLNEVGVTLTARDVERVHFVGPDWGKQTRPILMRVTNFKDKLAIMDKKKIFREQGITIVEDYPNEIIQRRNVIVPIFFKAIFIYLFGVLRRFQHCTGHITTGSWKGRGNQYI